MAIDLSQSTVAPISTAGVERGDDVPFDQEGERRNPWWGDPPYRAIPASVTEADVNLYHLPVDTRFGRQDLDVVLPMRRLRELLARKPWLLPRPYAGEIPDEP